MYSSDSESDAKPAAKKKRSFTTIPNRESRMVPAAAGVTSKAAAGSAAAGSAAAAASSETATASIAAEKRKRKQTPPRRLARRDLMHRDGVVAYKYATAAGGGGGSGQDGTEVQVVKFHPDSKWQEPYDETTSLHGLTLYEVQRQPRSLRDALNDENHEAILWEISSRKQRTGRSRKRNKSKRNSLPSLETAEASASGRSLYTRVRCDYEYLMESLRCVICFGTLRHGKMVRECLHRFCERCIETCLRRFRNNSCPVCRIDVPSRRSLAVDVVFNTLIEAFLLREDRAEDPDRQLMVDEAMAIAASLEDATSATPPTPAKEDATANEGKDDRSNNNNNNTITETANPQVMIAKNRRLRLEEKRRQDGESRAIGPAALLAAQAEAAAKTTHAGAASDSAEVVPPLVELLLKPHATELDTLPPLEMPYLRLAGNATIAVLETFLKAKLGPLRSSSSPTTQQPSTPSSTKRSTTSKLPSSTKFYFSQKLWRRPLMRDTQLQHLQAMPNSNNLCVLYYRRTKLVQKPATTYK